MGDGDGVGDDGAGNDVDKCIEDIHNDTDNMGIGMDKDIHADNIQGSIESAIVRYDAGEGPYEDLAERNFAPVAECNFAPVIQYLLEHFVLPQHQMWRRKLIQQSTKISFLFLLFFFFRGFGLLFLFLTNYSASPSTRGAFATTTRHGSCLIVLFSSI